MGSPVDWLNLLVDAVPMGAAYLAVCAAKTGFRAARISLETARTENETARLELLTHLIACREQAQRSRMLLGFGSQDSSLLMSIKPTEELLEEWLRLTHKKRAHA
jgi:hypothetical protein